MINAKRIYLLRTVNALLFFALIIVQYSNIINLKIRNANPMLPLALLVAVAIFSSELTAAISGLIVGIFIDAVASTPPAFNAVLFLVLGLSVSLIIRHLFNNNIFSAVTLCLICGFVYYLLRWLVCMAFSLSFSDNLIYLIQFAFTSTLYTTLFIIPFYYFEKFLHGKFYH